MKTLSPTGAYGLLLVLPLLLAVLQSTTAHKVEGVRRRLCVCTRV